MDEKTPHLHVYHVPEALDAKNRPTLSAKQFYGSRGLLTQLQTDYADHMKGFDPELKRGMSKSRARHKAIRTWYNEIEQGVTIKIPNLKTGLAVATPPRMIKQDRREDWAKQQSKSLQERFQDRLKRMRERLRKAIRAARHWKREFDQEKQRSAAYSQLVDDPSEIDRILKDAQEAKAQAAEALETAREASQTARGATNERDYWKAQVQDLEHRASASERRLKTLCSSVGIEPDQVEDKAEAIGKLWNRDVLNKWKNRGHNHS